MECWRLTATYQDDGFPSMVKDKFGDSLRSKSDVGQIDEALCKVLSATTSAS